MGIRLRRRLIGSNHVTDSVSFHEQGGWPYPFRCHDPAREEGTQTHGEKRILAKSPEVEARA
jgi:hypothetical protein